MNSEEEKVEIFKKHRPRLFGIAYRMLGTRDDAEDILQEAYIRWHKADLDEIETPEAWLVTVVSRLSIDRLRKASVERETYIGPCYRAYSTGNHRGRGRRLRPLDPPYWSCWETLAHRTAGFHAHVFSTRGYDGLPG